MRGCTGKYWIRAALQDSTRDRKTPRASTRDAVLDRKELSGLVGCSYVCVGGGRGVELKGGEGREAQYIELRRTCIRYIATGQQNLDFKKRRVRRG